MAILVALAVLGLLIAMPIVAIVRTGRIRELEARIARLEQAQLPAAPAEPPIPVASPPVPEPIRPTQPVLPAEPEPVAVVNPVVSPRPAGDLELAIGRRWIGLVAIGLIVVATAFFLKYAFENRWIGELGRVTMGIAAGLTLVWTGHRLHGRRGRYLSQILTGGGIVILYLSVYGAFAYYHLVDQRTAFIFLAILVAEAHLLAMAYGAPPIAVLAVAGGFLVPLLLSSGRDQYRILFTYIAILDLGTLFVAVARSWRWIGSLSYVGTQLLFWGWYGEHYHPEKRLAALLFQTAIFLIFTAADLAPNLRRRPATWEEWIRLAINPFVFYALCYQLLNGDYHDWMAVLALLLATAYAALARAELHFCPSDRRALLVTLGTALTFVTLAIPIQLDANWITIAWSVEALMLLWAASQTPARRLRLFSAAVFAMALFQLLFYDTPGSRAPFIPVFNRYFLGMLVLAGCLGAAAYLLRRESAALKIGLLAFGVFWFGSSLEAYTYFAAQAGALPPANENIETARHLIWAGRLSLSLLWSVYAGLLTAAGFRLRIRALRVAGLILFGVTLVKVVAVDISELREFYRIVALLILGLVLLGVAWKYQRSLRPEQAS